MRKDETKRDAEIYFCIYLVMELLTSKWANLPSNQLLKHGLCLRSKNYIESNLISRLIIKN